MGTKKQTIDSSTEFLLNTDNEKIITTTQRVKLNRHSELAGEDIMFDVKALSHKEIKDLLTIKDDSKFTVAVVSKSVSYPKLNDARLLKAYHCKTPEELIQKILLPAEIETLFRAFEVASGLKSHQDLKAKNENIHKKMEL